MIDIRIHISPSLDNKSKAIEESAVLAKATILKGIIATPHHLTNLFTNNQDTILT